jgi:hypothetical protein
MAAVLECLRHPVFDARAMTNCVVDMAKSRASVGLSVGIHLLIFTLDRQHDDLSNLLNFAFDCEL